MDEISQTTQWLRGKLEDIQNKKDQMELQDKGEPEKPKVLYDMHDVDGNNDILMLKDKSILKIYYKNRDQDIENPEKSENGDEESIEKETEQQPSQEKPPRNPRLKSPEQLRDDVLRSLDYEDEQMKKTFENEDK